MQAKKAEKKTKKHKRKEAEAHHQGTSESAAVRNPRHAASSDTSGHSSDSEDEPSAKQRKLQPAVDAEPVNGQHRSHYASDSRHEQTRYAKQDEHDGHDRDERRGPSRHVSEDQQHHDRTGQDSSRYSRDRHDSERDDRETHGRDSRENDRGRGHHDRYRHTDVHVRQEDYSRHSQTLKKHGHESSSLSPPRRRR